MDTPKYLYDKSQKGCDVRNAKQPCQRGIVLWIVIATALVMTLLGALVWELVARTQTDTTINVDMVVLDATQIAPHATVDVQLALGSKWSSIEVKDIACSMQTGEVLIDVLQHDQDDGYHLEITTREQDVPAHAALLWAFAVLSRDASTGSSSVDEDSMGDVLDSLVCHVQVGILLGYAVPFSYTVKLHVKDFVPENEGPQEKDLDDEEESEEPFTWDTSVEKLSMHPSEVKDFVPENENKGPQEKVQDNEEEEEPEEPFTWGTSVEKLSMHRLEFGVHVAMPAKSNDAGVYPRQVRVILPALTIHATPVDVPEEDALPAMVMQTNFVNTTLMEVLEEHDQEDRDMPPWCLLLSTTCDATGNYNEQDPQPVIFSGSHHRKENRKSGKGSKCAWYAPLLDAVTTSTDMALHVHVDGGGSFLETLLGVSHLFHVRPTKRNVPPISTKPAMERPPLQQGHRRLQTDFPSDMPSFVGTFDPSEGASTIVPTDGLTEAATAQDSDEATEGAADEELSTPKGQQKNNCLRMDDETGAFDIGFCYFLHLSKGFTMAGDLAFYDYFMSGKFEVDWEQPENATDTTFQLESKAIANMHDDGRLNMTMQLTLDWTENTNVVILMQAVNTGSFAPFALFVESSANSADEDLFTLQILQATLTLDNDDTPLFDPTGDLVVNSAEQSISFNMQGDNLVGSLQGALLPDEDTLMATNTFVWEGEEVWNMALLGQIATSNNDATDLVLQLNETMAIGFALVGKVEVDSITQTFKATLEEVERDLMQLSLDGTIPEDEGTLMASTLLMWDGIDVWNMTMEGRLEEDQDLFTNGVTFTMSLQEEVTSMLGSGSVKILNSDVLSIVIQRFAFQYDLEALIEMTGALTIDCSNSAVTMVLEDVASLDFAANASLTWFSDDENAERGATLQQAVISYGGDVVLFLIDSTFTDQQGAGSVFLVSDSSAKMNLGLSVSYRWWDFLDLLTVQFQQILVGWEGEIRADLTGQARLDIVGESLVTITMEDYIYLDMEANITLGWLTEGVEKGIVLHKALLDVALEPIMDLEGHILFDTETCSEEDDGRCSLNFQVEDFGNLDFVTKMIGNWGTESASETIFFNLNELSLVAASETFIDLVMGFRLEEQKDLIVGKMDCLSDPIAELDMNMAMNFSMDSNDGTFAILMDHMVLGWGDTTLMEILARPARFSSTQETSLPTQSPSKMPGALVTTISLTPTAAPTPGPIFGPTQGPSSGPTWGPSVGPTPGVTPLPTPEPSTPSSESPSVMTSGLSDTSPAPSAGATLGPSIGPTRSTPGLTQGPSFGATPGSTFTPSELLTSPPTQIPTVTPGSTFTPSVLLTSPPTQIPTVTPGSTFTPSVLLTSPPTQIPTVTPGSTFTPSVLLTSPPTESPAVKTAPPVLLTEPISQRFDNMTMVVPGVTTLLSDEARDAWVATTEKFYNELYNTEGKSSRWLRALQQSTEISNFVTTIDFKSQLLGTTGLNILYGQIITYTKSTNSTASPLEYITAPLEESSTNADYTSALRTSNDAFQDVQDNSISAPIDIAASNQNGTPGLPQNVVKNNIVAADDDGLGAGAIAGIAIVGFACCVAFLFFLIRTVRDSDDAYEDDEDLLNEDDGEGGEEGDNFISNGYDDADIEVQING